MKRSSQNENSILERIAARMPSSRRNARAGALLLGMGDDAALFRPKRGYETILTCDWFLEGTHFWRDKHPPEAVGWKCLARAVSDIAAMGGTPKCFLLSLALPETLTGRWLDLFLGGLRHASRKFKCLLAGGDTTRSRNVAINVTVVGEVPTGFAALRSGAQAGDILCVSGRLGEAELGLQLLKWRNERTSRGDPQVRKHLYPEPRIAFGRWLAEKRMASAMMDLSDGLSSDLPRLCAASSVGARVETARIPSVRVSDLRQLRGSDPLQLALHGGDDYELLFTVPAKKLSVLPQSYRGLALTAIGKITREPTLVLVEQGGNERPLVPGGWDPFQSLGRPKPRR